MSEYREEARKILDAIEYELHPWEREKFVASRLASFALEQRRKFEEVAKAYIDAVTMYRATQDEDWLNMLLVTEANLRRALAEQEPSTRKSCCTDTSKSCSDTRKGE